MSPQNFACSVLRSLAFRAESSSSDFVLGSCLQTSQVHPLVINPKSVTLSELYGAYDLSTFEWADGILSTLFKQSAESDKPDEKVRKTGCPVADSCCGTRLVCNRPPRLVVTLRIGWLSLLSLLSLLSFADNTPVRCFRLLAVDHVRWTHRRALDREHELRHGRQQGGDERAIQHPCGLPPQHLTTPGVMKDFCRGRCCPRPYFCRG